MKLSLFSVLLFASLLLSIHCSKRNRDDFSENTILDDDVEALKRQATETEGARNLLNTASLDQSDFESFFLSCPRDSIVSNFVFLFDAEPYPNSKQDLALVLVRLRDISLIQQLAHLKADCLVDLLVAAKTLKNGEIFDYCVPLVQMDPIKRELAFRAIFKGIISGYYFDEDLQWILRWASIVFDHNQEDMEDNLFIPKSAKPAAVFLLQNMKECEIEYFFNNIRKISLHEILMTACRMIVAYYSEEDDYSLTAKITAIDLVNSLNRPQIYESMQLTEDIVAEYKSVTEVYQTSLLEKDELCRQVIRLVMSTSAYPSAFKLIVSTIGKKSTDLLHYGAIEFLTHFEGDEEEEPEDPFPYYDFSQVDPAYDNYRIFQVVLGNFNWFYYMEHLFFGSKWYTKDCIKNIYRILREMLPGISGRLQIDGDRRRIGTYYSSENQFTLYKDDDVRTSELDFQVETVYYVCDYFYRHEGGSHKYLSMLLRDIALHIPELLPYLRDDFEDLVSSTLRLMGTSYIEAAIRFRSLDAAIYAAKVAKDLVAAYLLQIYDEIPRREFQVPFENVEMDEIHMNPTPFYNTILAELYSDTEYEDVKVLIDDENWESGKDLLLYIAIAWL